MALQLRRGNFADLPALQPGEPGWCLDTYQLFIGTDGTLNGNKEVSGGAAAAGLGLYVTGAGTLNVGVDPATEKVNSSNLVEGLKYNSLAFTLTGSNINNQYIDLPHTVYGISNTQNSVSLTPQGGPPQVLGTDFNVSLTGGVNNTTRISFIGALALGGISALVSGDTLIISYNYL